MKRQSRKNWKNYNIHLSISEEVFAPDFEDPRDNKFALAGLANGNKWAWCTTHVLVSCAATAISESDELHGCSYHSREDFMRPGGYYDCMVNGCIKKIESEKDRLRSALCVCGKKGKK
jgi:hypothetical protein